MGCYTASDGKLSMSAPTVVTSPFGFRGDELLLMREGKEPFAYGRVAAGPWYPRDPAQIRSQAQEGVVR